MDYANEQARVRFESIEDGCELNEEEWEATVNEEARRQRWCSGISRTRTWRRSSSAR